MKLQINDLENGIRMIVLNGKLDSSGVYAVEVDFIRHCVGENQRILVDLSSVNYISSIGIPMLVNTAKTVVQNGGKLALFRPQKNVLDVLDLVGVSRFVPIYFDLASARLAY
ncbi:MAG: STAS domain-containing protein [Anaerolineales bacterium]|nr:STAS domain-containing protein [Anaerolineales bacterium]